MRAPGLRIPLIRLSLAVLALYGVMAGSAQARIFIGFGVPLLFPPLIVPPPVYYPPYYGPPPGYVPPRYYDPYRNQGYAPSGGYPTATQSCRAGQYVCPLIEDTPPGGRCSCPGHGGQRIRGTAD